MSSDSTEETVSRSVKWKVTAYVLSALAVICYIGIFVLAVGGGFNFSSGTKVILVGGLGATGIASSLLAIASGQRYDTSGR